MSAPSAIATVTSSLRNLLTQAAQQDPELIDTTVTTQAPNIARNGNDANQLNLFLYATEIDTAFSNSPMPFQTKNGETGIPPLALVLKYLITAYGRNNDDINGHRLMGRCMSALHDHPVLSRAELEAALLDNDLHNQVERVRITPNILLVDDMSKLWTSFQAEYRLSTAYAVSVVLIESSLAAKTPLPVLRRGENDQGVTTQADLIANFPTINAMTLPNRQQSVLLGDTLILNGHHLDGDTVSVLFNHPRLIAPLEVFALPGGNEQQVLVQLPNIPTDWLIGFYTVQVFIQKAGEQDRSSNILPISLAPQIQGIAPANPLLSDGLGNVILTITVNPEIRTEQRATLLLGDREVLAQAHPAQTNTLNFIIANAPSGNFYVRLRIDGIDNLLIDRSVTPPIFDSALEVVIV